MELFDQLSTDQLIRLAWTTGKLDYKVRDYQMVVWQRMCELAGRREREVLSPEAIAARELVLTMSRRWGKTTLGFLLLMCCALERPNTTYYFVAPTERDAKEIISDVSTKLMDDCPMDLRPEVVGDIFHFHNGSQVRVGGTWNGSRGLRGREGHGVVVDEAAFIPQSGPSSCLSYVMTSVISPLLLTTKGWRLIESTPPVNMKHDYVTIHRQAEQDGRLSIFTIYENTSLTSQEIEAEKQRSYTADPTGSSWRREYLAELVPQLSDLIIPQPASQALRVEAYARPQTFDVVHKYIILDHGTTDLTAVLFGYYDYMNAKRVVEASLLVPKQVTTKVIAEMVQAKRAELWGPEATIFRSVADSISHQLIIDLNSEMSRYNIQFVHPSKTDLEAMVNQTIMAMSDGSLVINSDTSNNLLLETIRSGTWKVSNSGKREFARLNEIGHCDFLAALIYFIRMCITTINPYNAIPLTSSQFRNPYASGVNNDAHLHSSLVKALQGPKSGLTRR